MQEDWFFYDWVMEGDPASFAVDMRLAAKPHPARPVLLHVRCEMRDEAPLTPRGIRHIERIQSKCIKSLASLYAGYVQDERRRVMFFYVDSDARLEDAEAIFAREKLLYCEAGCAPDPEWSTYYQLLYPDAAKLYTATNRKNIDLYRQNGDHSAAARRVTLHMFFPMEQLVAQFASEARLAGFAIGDAEFNPDLEEAYGVKLYIITSLNKRDIDGCTSTAIYIAERYGGRLLYWDCPVIPRTSPLR